jgi:two-component system, NarL family, sensor histidine kinase DesK
MNLLPPNRDHGWVPYLWLVYLYGVFVHPVFDHVRWMEWAVTLAVVAVFLILYFSFFWLKPPKNLWAIGGMLLIGVGLAPSNGGASAFFIYTAAFVPFAIESESLAFGALVLIACIAGLEAWLFHLGLSFGFWSGGLALLIGGGNIFFAQRNRANCRLKMANAEIEHLAKVAERERIARDLHDVLGHTLSVIILKSELAGKLIDRDPERARAEIADVEETSRQALAEVRATIRGYRAHSLEEELKKAKAMLETAGVSVQSEATNVNLSPVQESVVAMAVREAVTNIVRHAGAHTCSLRLAPVDGTCFLEVRDDGQGGYQIEGNGLRGMRERIEALGGTLARETTAGTRLTIQFPLTPSKAIGNL